jgi:hypothetical protein
MLKISKLIFFIFMALTTLSCEDSEQKKLGEAQACLDRVPQNSPSSAIKCYSYIQDVDTPTANALRCSIGFLAAGISTTKIVDAVKRIGSGTNSEEVFISLLVFNGIDPADTDADATGVQAIENVTNTVSHCNDSGVKGLMYLGNFAVAGTALIQAIKPDPDTAFWSNPVFVDVDNEVETAVNNCATTPENCNPAAVGSAILTLGESYCKGKSDDAQCAQVQAAIAAGGGDASAIGAAFFEELNKDNPTP